MNAASKAAAGASKASRRTNWSASGRTDEPVHAGVLHVAGKLLSGWVVIDMDATLITAHSDKHGAAATFKRGFGFRAGIAALIRSARPDLSRAEANRRAADIDVVQNGIWLTALLGLDKTSIRRNIAHCEELAFAD